MDFVIFIISTSGLVLILNKSVLFKPLRNYISSQKENLFWWFLNSLFGCSLCMGVWVSIPVWFIQKTDLYFISYAFAGALMAHIFSILTEMINRK